MDLIYMNSYKEDIGVLKDYTFDLAFGSDENDFECTVNINNHVCEAGYYLYYEGSEYGGIIDKVSIDTEQEQVTYTGRTWHGLLESKILQPDEGSDYLTLSGEANSVIGSLITRMGVGGLFKVSTESSGVNISTYKMNRYIGGYTGIMKMLKANGGKLNISFKRGFVELSAIPLVDYSQDEQFDTDQISFTIQRNINHVNHVICLGQGDLKDRRVIHLYVDSIGNVSGTQTLTGLDEVCVTYDNGNAESDDELIEGGLDIIKESWAEDSVEFSFDSNDESFDVNDIIGAKERITGTFVSSYITKKIVRIEDNTTSISYSCESNTGTIASSGYPSSGSGGGSSITIDSELSTTSENPVQNKVVTKEITKIKSHIGMVIQTTTLDTMDKVISIYGGTKWVKIEGRMLLGASSSYKVNSTGGEATHVLTANEIPSHNHLFTGNRSLTEGGGEHSHNAERSYGVAGRNDWGLMANGAFGGNVLLTNYCSSTLGTIKSAGSHQHYYTPSGYIGNSGGSKEHNNMPPYKVVYIWERTE